MFSVKKSHEWNLGDLEGVHAKKFLRALRESHENFTPLGGEAKYTFYERAIKSINSILSNTDKQILIVAHGGVFWAITDTLKLKVNTHLNNCELLPSLYH
jgi:broad specificity phosphatase PhoE